MERKKKYEKISDERRIELEELLYETIVSEFRKEKLGDNYYKYEVTLQKLQFCTRITNEELRECAKLVIDLIEELKDLNNNGMDRENFIKMAESECKKHEEEIMKVLAVWGHIDTKGLKEIIVKIDKAMRVGGAYALIISNPGLINAICVVYEVLVDKFDDEELYDQSCYFILRAVMRMHSDEL